MTDRAPPPPDSKLPAVPPARGRTGEIRAFLRRAVPFAVVGLVLYLLVYGASEVLVYETAERNRFYTVKMAPRIEYDYVILGASHAAVFDYRDMNARLEDMTGAEILNLANVGAGIAVNDVLLDYFYRTGHETNAVVYVLDSFAFYSTEWNEDRLQDTELYARAPFDPTLAQLLLDHSATGWSVFLDYVTGFSKINNPDRFAPDLFEAEGSRFERTYRPIPQIDRQRISYLYPDSIDPSSFETSPYLEDFETLIRDVQSRGDRFIIVRPPVPDRIYEMIPHEADFDRDLENFAESHEVQLYDFTSVTDDPEFFYDSDHLNREGTIRFFEQHLSGVLAVSDHGPGE